MEMPKLTKKAARQLLKNMENLSEVIIGKTRISKVFDTYAISKDVKDTREFHGDRDTFVYGYKLSWVLNDLLNENSITE